MNYLKIILGRTYAPRWLIFQIDILLILASCTIAYLLRFDFNLSSIPPHQSYLWGFLIVFIRLIFYYISKTHHGIIRYTSIEDAKRLFITLTTGTAFLLSFNYFHLVTRGTAPFPTMLLIFEYFATSMLLAGFRIFVKISYTEIKNRNTKKDNVVIFGAGESGVITKRTIDQDKDSRKKIIAFFDDDSKKVGKVLDGVKIYPSSDLSVLTKKLGATELVISVQKIGRKRKQEIVDVCIENKIKVKIIPSASNWVNGELSTKQIKDVKIENLLERDPIQLNQDGLNEQIKGKTIFVTGAAGSIGSELVRQIIRFMPGQLIMIDQAETPLYEIELEIREKYSYVNFLPIIADVRNKDKIRGLIEKYQPEIIYHAAAYKHVPLMELNPSEAIKTNVEGTKNLADLALEYNVKKFVFISTDKAVNPTNVMGASKRIAEIYVQSLNTHYHTLNYQHTKFITTRFGNVLGSNGSVIPRFRKQIEEGGPVTVTHPEICRYFMTIPEACQLILEAGLMGEGGEIFIFDMGEPVKIADLAKRMITLSGFTPNKEINITFTGLRPGEKIKEELLNDSEKTLTTHHKKIMIGKVREYPFNMVCSEIAKLINTAYEGDTLAIVKSMKSIVPEFISNNSVYESLDKINLKEDNIKISK